MARFKVFAHHAVIAAAFLGFFGGASLVAYEAAGAAISFGSAAVAR